MGERKKLHILLLFLLIFYQRDHRNQSLLPRPAPHHGFAGGTHQPLVFYFFKKPLPEQPRIPLRWVPAALWWPFWGNCSPANQPGSGCANPNPIPASPSAPQPWPGGQASPCGALEEPGHEPTPNPSANWGMVPSAFPIPVPGPTHNKK